MAERIRMTETERPSAIWLTAVFQSITPRRLLLAMMVLQLIWLGIIWGTGAATAVYKLPPLILYTLATGLTVAFMPTALVQKWHTAVTYFTDHPKIGVSVLLLFVFLAGSVYASQQRLWPFDEQASFEAAVTVAQTGIPGLLQNYQNWGWLATQHPPLAPIVYGQFVSLFGESLFVARILSLLFTLATALLTYLIGAELYDRRTGFVAACFFCTFPLVVRLSGTAMVEPMLVFFLASPCT
ncbi:MAG: phospholipid carrier-dependent glycosyltransferase [Anaerolineae bacterium]|nr:phospholipid carrier-dependent glycosyltransferase [Anaerolineae bacterium]